MSTLESLIKKQGALSEQISKAAVNHKKTGKARRTEGYFNARIALLKDVWDQFAKNHIEIWETSLDQANEYISDNMYENTEEMYFDLLALLNAELEECTKGTESKHSTSPNTSTASIKLPPIAIPKFDGNYKTWRSFHDLFSSLIDSDDKLSKVQKLHYLKTNVSGEAERLLRQFEIIDSNYEKAWELLTKRYNNKRALVNHQLKCLLNQSQIRAETPLSIKTFLDQTEECVHELQALDLPVDKWDAILIHILIQKLPQETHYHWEQELRNKTKLPSYSEFTAFLETRFRTLEALHESNKTTSPKTTYGLLNEHKSLAKNHKSKTTCIRCGANHIIYHCPTFRDLTTRQRHEFATNKRLCKNCLSPNHPTANCPSNKKCYHCNKNHNTLLHFEQPPSNSASKPMHNSTQNFNMEAKQSAPASKPEEQQVQNFLTSNMKSALLSTALINVSTPSGKTQTFRALIDSGSQVSIMTEKVYKRLQLKGSPTNYELVGLSRTQTNIAQKQATITMKSLHSNFKMKLNMLIIKKITDLLPTQTINTSTWNHIHNLPLADPTFATPGDIDILLGADAYAEIITDGIIKGSYNSPVAQNTKLGWILIGKVPEAKTFSIISTHISDNNRLEDQLKQFWEIEECQTSQPLSPEDQLCEKLYEQTTTRLPNGKYQVHLPFKGLNPPQLGQSRNMAVQQFLQLEKKFSKHPELQELYKTCIQEYSQLGHMKRIPPTQVQSENKYHQHFPFYYLPHHAVAKESTTTKLRVVFNASAKTSNGKSLNEQLLIGPTLQPTLWSTLLRWRLYKFAFTADIEKMYRMIQMTTDHQNYQRIIWRDNPDEELQDYALTTVTFGTAPAPYLAIRTLQQLARDEANNYPLAARSLMKDFYVDDVVSGAHNLSEAQELQNQLIESLKKGAFNLRKWTANHPDLLKNIHPDHRELKTNLEFSETESIKTLGIQWYPKTDSFSFKVKLPEPTNTYTKRRILSEVSTLFDPLGWLAPCIITAKILIQKLWLIKCDWDDEVPGEVSREWITFKNQLNLLQSINIPRWLGYEPKSQDIEIHGFCDASNKAYSAVLYLKTTANGQPRIQLITAKTKVAPVKTISLPRLELCGAVLLSRLIKQVSTDLDIKEARVFAWTDSKITLAWIRKFHQPGKHL